MALMSAYDAAAPSFDRHRALPDAAADAIRTAILAHIDGSLRPRLLDLGAGTGRIGRPFVTAGDDYVGVDLSLGMLREFVRRAGEDGNTPGLVQTDGRRLPFRDATFGAVMLIQMFGGMRGWEPLITEARRVLRSAGVLVIGRSALPADGVDARMKQRLVSLLGGRGVQLDAMNAREVVAHWLASAATGRTRVVVGAWDVDRTPRDFLDRHPTGARFSALPGRVKKEALSRLESWATETFGSLDAKFSERHAFELQVFKFQQGLSR
jgi:SAM-dependent methyltransferase